MSKESERHPLAPERLSALMDGELDGAAVGQACGHWRDDAGARADWHAFHLIGDVLRADDLACDPARDLAFMQAFRARLASEPVVLAPTPPALVAAPLGVGGTAGRRWSWRAPSAVAAGFAAVAGVLILTRGPGAPLDRTASAPIAIAAPVASPTPTRTASEPQTFVASGQLIRDARLDRYLDAHQQFAGSSALGVPSAFLRSATTVNAPDR